MSPVEQLEQRPAVEPTGAAKPGQLRVGVVGYGYWGPNVVRNLHALDTCQVVSLCDKNPNALAKAQKMTPEELKGKHVIGVLHQDDRTEFCDVYDNMMAQMKGGK